MRSIIVSFLVLVPAQDDAVKKAVEDFKAKIKDAKSVQEKALAIQALSNVEPRDPAYAKEIGRFLAATSADIHFILPTTAIDALVKYRGAAPAAQAIVAALPAYKRIPYVYHRLLPALGRVGHESAFPTFEEMIRGRDAGDAVKAVEGVREMPAGPAVEFLFRQHEWVEKEKPNASDKQKPVLDKVGPEITSAIQDLSGEKYPFNEMLIWWKKRGADFKKKSAEKEAELANAPRAPEPPGLPPLKILEVLCNEGNGSSAANTGSSSVHYPVAQLSPGPKWVDNPAYQAGKALDFGPKPGPHALDLPGALEHLRNLKSFTVTGWINCRDLAEGPGGNRLVSWYHKDREGVDLSVRSDGGLQLGVNQWADASSAKSPPGQIPVADETAKDGLRNNWRFFAVSYDSGLAAGHAKFYAGSATGDATLAGAADCNRGPVGAKFAPALSIGNVNPAARGAGDRAFRGILDEIRIFGSTLDGSGALALERLVEVQNRQARPTAKK